jgi:phospholipase C
MRRIIWMTVLLALGCDGGSTMDAGSDAGMDAGHDAGPPTSQYDGGPVTRIAETEAAAGREGCSFGRGAYPWQTIGEEFPIGDDIPIDHVIILMQENRSFDHYFGMMPGVDGIQGGASNPDASGAPVAAFRTDEYCVRDPNHNWNGSHEEWNEGANDGFVTVNDPGGERAMGYFTDTDLPFYWDLAQTFAISDQHFCSLLGPTWVNRYYMLSGTSFGLIRNEPIPSERMEGPGEHMIFQQLDRAAVDWRVYHDAVPFEYGGYPTYALRNREHFSELEQLFVDLDAGDLPPVSFVEPLWDFVAGVHANDEHPPADPQYGQAWVRDIVMRVMNSSAWPRTAIIITYDEHGGFYDHVAPPEACPPDEFAPDLTAGDYPGEFDRLGFRVPLYVVSPYSRPGYVSDRDTDHASILRFLQTRFMMPAMTARDANAWPLLDMFDFTNAALLTPPDLAEAPIDEAAVTACEIAFPE